MVEEGGTILIFEIQKNLEEKNNHQNSLLFFSFFAKCNGGSVWNFFLRPFFLKNPKIHHLFAEVLKDMTHHSSPRNFCHR